LFARIDLTREQIRSMTDGQPVGIDPSHVIVKNGRTMLLGVVDSAADRQLAQVRAREVTGVFDVENSLAVAR
jgi:osmotically-inducible protein OsmY